MNSIDKVIEFEAGLDDVSFDKEADTWDVTIYLSNLVVVISDTEGGIKALAQLLCLKSNSDATLLKSELEYWLSHEKKN